MHNSKSPETPRKLFLEIIKNTEQRKYQRGATTVHEGGGALAPLGRAPLPRGPPVASPTPTPTPYIEFRGEKNQGEEIIAFYDTEPPPMSGPRLNATSI